MKKLFALLLAAAMLLTFAACGKEDSTNTDSTESTGTTDAAFVSYTGSDADVLAARETVVATLGDMELTNGQLQIYYWTNVLSFLQENSYYLSYYGLDYTQPLDEQECSFGDGTWQEYFLAQALDTWHSYRSLSALAEQNSTPLDEESQTTLDSLYTDLSKTALDSGFESVDALLQANFGPGCVYDDYYAYTVSFVTAYSYFSTARAALEITDDMIEEYFTTHESALSEEGITKESGNSYDVRHILIEIEGGTTDEDGNTTYSDDEWEACRVKAQDLLDQWLAGEHTEETFGEFANEHSADGGSNTAGGLYQGLTDDTSFVQEFKDWYLDESRQVGDYGLIKTTYGYHLMYLSATEPEWIATCRSSLESGLLSNMINEAMAQYTLNVSYDDILLGYVDLAVTE